MNYIISYGMLGVCWGTCHQPLGSLGSCQASIRRAEPVRCTSLPRQTSAGLPHNPGGADEPSENTPPIPRVEISTVMTNIAMEAMAHL